MTADNAKMENRIFSHFQTRMEQLGEYAATRTQLAERLNQQMKFLTALGALGFSFDHYLIFTWRENSRVVMSKHLFLFVASVCANRRQIRRLVPLALHIHSHTGSRWEPSDRETFADDGTTERSIEKRHDDLPGPGNCRVSSSLPNLNLKFVPNTT